jgi:chromosomal replication initiator protein
MENIDIWNKGLSLIKKNLNNDIFELWFKPTAFKSYNNGEINISVPNRYCGEWLKTNYYSLIKDALVNITQEMDIKINFIPDKDKEGIEKTEIIKKEAIRTTSFREKGMLNKRYYFENFIVGPSNQFAHAAALAVAENPGKSYNPLFIYGGVGLGKTHLINAIGNHIIRNKPDVKIIYLTAEQFTNEVVAAIRYDKMYAFKEKYRNIDMLLVDDIQFFSGKDRSQEEFFYTFNTLYEAHRPVIITSDKYPKEMPDVEERLRSRFEWGLIADIQQPDFETRMAILKQKAETENIKLPEDVILFLVDAIKTNIRVLEGALIRLGAYASLTGKAITVELAKDILKATIGDKEKAVTYDAIQKAVADHFQIKLQEMKAKKRTKNLVMPRQVAMYLCRELTNLSYPEIGKYFGGKDHTTVIHACRQIEKLKEKESRLKDAIDALTKALKSQ